jgi:hypothetical protein
MINPHHLAKPNKNNRNFFNTCVTIWRRVLQAMLSHETTDSNCDIHSNDPYTGVQIHPHAHEKAPSTSKLQDF